MIVTDIWPRLRDILLKECRSFFPAMGAYYTISDRTWHFKNGATVRLRAYTKTRNQNADQSSLEGQDVHAVLVDECQALDPSVYTVARERARVDAVDLTGEPMPPLVVLCGTPQDPAWWLEKTIAVGGFTYLPQSDETTVGLGNGYLDRMKACLSPAEFDAKFGNNPMVPEGRVLDTWGTQCLVSGWQKPPGAETVLALDLGYRMPSVLVLTHDLSLKSWVLWDEWHPDNCLTYELAEGLKERNKLWGAKKIVHDPAGAARNGQTGQSDVSVLRSSLGILMVSTTDVKKRDIKQGIIRVRQALYDGRLKMTQEMWAKGSRAPEGARTLARSILGYSYPQKGGGDPVKDGVFDHAIDALRYFCIHALWEGPYDIQPYKYPQIEVKLRGPKTYKYLG